MNKKIIYALVALFIFLGVIVLAYSLKNENAKSSAYYSESGKTYEFTFLPDWEKYILENAIDSSDLKLLAALKETKEKISVDNNLFISQFAENFISLFPGDSLYKQFRNNENLGIPANIDNGRVQDELLLMARKDYKSTVQKILARSKVLGMETDEPEMKTNLGQFALRYTDLIKAEEFEKKLIRSYDIGFWEVYSNEEIFVFIDSLNEILIKKKKITEKASAPKPASKDGDIVSMSDVAIETKDETDSSLLTILGGGFGGENARKYASLSFVFYKDTSLLMHLLNGTEAKKIFPADATFIFGKSSIDEAKSGICILYCIKIPAGGKPKISGQHITDVRVGKNVSDDPEVMIRMTDKGTKIWSKMTLDNLDKCIAMVLDNRVLSAPVIGAQIEKGMSSISGSFTADEIDEIARCFQMGDLPVKVKIICKKLNE